MADHSPNAYTEVISGTTDVAEELQGRVYDTPYNWTARRKWGAAVLSASMTFVLTGCPGPGPAPVPPTGTTIAPPPSERTYTFWGSDGCLEYLVLDGSNTTVAVEATNLCRAADSTVPGEGDVAPGTYYSLYQRGSSPTNWLEIIDLGTDGFTYWTYQDKQWYRQQPGGNVQIAVYNDATGQVEYDDSDQFQQQYPNALSSSQVLKEGLATFIIAASMKGTAIQYNPKLSGSNTQEEQTQAQDGISTRNQQAQGYQNDAGSNNSSLTQEENQAAIDRERARQIKSEEQETTIIGAPNCANDDRVADGCGGSNAYNDDGGVGEGNDQSLRRGHHGPTYRVIRLIFPSPSGSNSEAIAQKPVAA